MNSIINLVISRRLRLVVNTAVKSLGTALILFGTSRMGTNSPQSRQIPQTSSTPVEEVVHDDYASIMKGDSLTTAILPLRKTNPAEIDQILTEASDMNSRDVNYSVPTEISNMGKNFAQYAIDAVTNLIFQRKKHRLSDDEIMNAIDGPTPGLTIQIQEADKVYKKTSDQAKILSIHLTLQNAARIGLLIKILKILLYAYLILKTWDIFVWLVSSYLKRSNASSSIDVDYKSIDDSDIELMKQRKIYLNPANYFKNPRKK